MALLKHGTLPFSEENRRDLLRATKIATTFRPVSRKGELHEAMVRRCIFQPRGISGAARRHLIVSVSLRSTFTPLRSQSGHFRCTSTDLRKFSVFSVFFGFFNFFQFFSVFFGFEFGLFWLILVLFWFILVYFGLFWLFLVYFGLVWFILV